MPCIETNEVNGHMVEAVGPSPSTPKLGMLAWRLLLHSPEFPEGRSVVLIANDVTHQAGWVPTWQDGCWRVKLGDVRIERCEKLCILFVVTFRKLELGFISQFVSL